MEPTTLISNHLLDAISIRAQEIYNDALKQQLEPEQNGQIVAIHLDTQDYIVALSSSAARFALRRRRKEGMIVTLDIGLVDEYDPLALRMLGTELRAHPPRK